MPSICSNLLPETTASHTMQYSLHVQNVEGRVNLDPWGMDTFVGCRIVEYLLSTVNTWVRAFYYKYLPRRAWFLRL